MSDFSKDYLEKQDLITQIENRMEEKYHMQAQRAQWAAQQKWYAWDNIIKFLGVCGIVIAAVIKWG